jgi:hypothetical protein
MQVFRDHTVTVTQHIGNDHKEQVAEQVMQPQGQQRQPVPQAVNHPKPDIVKSLFHKRLRSYNILSSQPNSTRPNNLNIFGIPAKTAQKNSRIPTQNTENIYGIPAKMMQKIFGIPTFIIILHSVTMILRHETV